MDVKDPPYRSTRFHLNFAFSPNKFRVHDLKFNTLQPKRNTRDDQTSQINKTEATAVQYSSQSNCPNSCTQSANTKSWTKFRTSTTDLRHRHWNRDRSGTYFLKNKPIRFHDMRMYKEKYLLLLGDLFSKLGGLLSDCLHSETEARGLRLRRKEIEGFRVWKIWRDRERVFELHRGERLWERRLSLFGSDDARGRFAAVQYASGSYNLTWIIKLANVYFELNYILICNVCF